MNQCQSSLWFIPSMTRFLLHTTFFFLIKEPYMNLSYNSTPNSERKREKFWIKLCPAHRKYASIYICTRPKSHAQVYVRVHLERCNDVFGSVVARFSSEAVAIRFLSISSSASRQHQAAQFPRDLDLDVPSLRWKPLLLHHVAATAAGAVLVTVLHHYSSCSPSCFFAFLAPVCWGWGQVLTRREGKQLGVFIGRESSAVLEPKHFFIPLFTFL